MVAQPGSGFSLDDAARSLLEPIHELLLRIDTRLADAEPTPSTPLAPPTSGGGRSSSSEMLYEINHAISDLANRLDRLEDAVANRPRSAPTASDHLQAPSAEQTGISWQGIGGGDEQWEAIFLGDQLCTDDSLAEHRRELLSDITAGIDSARALAGQLLLIQASAVDRIPELLRYVGEAFYRWRPRTTPNEDQLELALARWLNDLTEAAGLPNSIQLVSPGERFDNNRHVARGRGVKVVAVHGWVVLRDNQRVYTKANVSVQ
ncbi:MAG: hypothetical protein JJ992_08070 [Planctomycetes bacterium]|nr:hypothetical protein [Planctomycetota bacterium]